MVSFRPVSRKSPCTVCRRADWCSISADGSFVICRRVGAGEVGVDERLDRNGSPYWVHRLSSPPASLSTPQRSLASLEVCNRVYSELFCELQLTPQHRALLELRGFSEQVIQRFGFRSWPLEEARQSVAWRVASAVGGVQKVLGVPGFVIDRFRLNLAGSSGSAMLWPIWNLDGQIAAVRMRIDEPLEGGRYRWLSSARYGGPGAPLLPFWAPARWPKREERILERVVRLVEGEFKAIASAMFTGTFTVGVPGVSSWTTALPLLRNIGARNVRLAFDMDWKVKPAVARALVGAREGLLEQGWDVVIETWDPRFKGFDDLLSAQRLEAVPA